MLIQLEGISKNYQTGGVANDILLDINLTIDQGEFVAIMGASGSGKTTLLNIIGCLDWPTQGNYFFKDTLVTSLPDKAISELRSREIGFIFQSFNLLPRLSARRNVELPLIYQSVPGSKRRRSSEQMLARVGLNGKSHRLPAELSGGEQQRVAIARALVTEPSLLLADEPTGNLDSRTGIEIMEILGSLHKAGITIIMVTHAAELAEYSDRCVNLKDGQIQKVSINNNQRAPVSSPA
jgi:putative ABC transport system ATP-binding protein